MPAPLPLFRRVATAEAVTWALLLFGMVLKYGTHTTDLGVRLFGMAHGIVFIAYCLTTIVVAVDGRWGAKRLALGLLAAIPPFCTVVFDRWAERRGLLRDHWRLREQAPRRAVERVIAAGLARPGAFAAVAVVAVAALTTLALFAGPPASKG